jgi:DNA polymerase I-like protein with 3'-5' exonuclease and polymerase domains
MIIRSWAHLQEVSGQLAERLDGDPALALAAAANFLFALDELGYDIDPDARPEIEERLRFSRQAFARRQQLREAIHAHAGCAFSLESPAEVERILSDRLRLDTPHADVPRYAVANERLEDLRDAHPIVALLLEYRRLDQDARRLAPRAVYARIREGRLRTGVTRVRFRRHAR